MPWLPLSRFRDPTVPKLDNLRRAATAGVRVPTTWWLPAATAGQESAPPLGLSEPLILRSGSPTEDTRVTSNAGQLVSLPVKNRQDFTVNLARVVEALPRDAAGKPQGAVFAQPLIQALEAGVAFYDGFHYEQTRASASNEELTSGQQRGEVRRGHYERGEPWSEWLRALYAVFRSERRIDLEFARDAEGYVLLQVRPALFPLVRNPTLTVANHKETLGEHPSPFVVSAMVEAGHDMSFWRQLNPACGRWDEVYAVELAGQAWMNVSLWFHWLDHFGLPRTLLTSAVGGYPATPADARIIPGRLARSVPRLLWQHWLYVQKVRRVEADLRRLDEAIDRATELRKVYAATVQGLAMLLHTTFAIAALCSLVMGVRKALGITGSAPLVTRDMMAAYRRLFTLPDMAQRSAGLDEWLRQYGHRGPLETDLAQPRFSELRDVLWQDLQSALPGAGAPDGPAAAQRSRHWLRLLSWIETRREWFRDQAMRRWQRLRTRLRAEGARLVERGELESADDVFWLRGPDLRGQQPLRQAVAAAKEQAAALRKVNLPLTATRDQIEAVVAKAGQAQAQEEGRRVFPGIALTPAVVEGRAVRADSLTALLTEGVLSDSADVILVVPSLEPSWAVVFPRVAGVVAEVGGELSHASILLREAGRPAVVNCAGIFRQVRTGDRLRLDGARALVEVL
jgi:rifampicin phosphotransferase